MIEGAEYGPDSGACRQDTGVSTARPLAGDAKGGRA